MHLPHSFLAKSCLVALFLVVGSAETANSHPASGRPRGARENRLMACSNSGGSISPCTSTSMVSINTTGSIFIFTITNTSSNYDEGGISCAVVFPVTACTLATTDYGLNGHTSMTDTAYYDVGSTTGPGTLTVTTGGLIGALTATLSVTVVGAPYAVSVTPKNQAVTAAGVTTNVQSFTVKNTGANSASFDMNAPACGGTATACTLTSTHPVTIAVGATATATVSYTASTMGSAGTVRLAAWYVSNTQVTDTGSVNETVGYRVAVTPDNGNVTAPPLTAGTQVFTVTNNRPVPATTTYNLTALCTTTVTNCSVPASVTVNASTGSPVNVGYTSGALATSGTVKLFAKQSTDSLNIDSGWVTVTSTQQGTPVVIVDSVNPGKTVDRDRCLTISVGPGAAYECGDLRLVYGLPSVRTMNETRTPILFYSSQHGSPYPLVAALVTEALGTAIPDSVTATLQVNGVTRGTGGTWKGSDWGATGATRRIVVGYGAWSDSTGLYSYSLQVTNWYGVTTKAQTASGSLIVVNRARSALGAGWWLAGLERLYFPSSDTTTRLWIGGDGSARLYSKVASNLWAAPAVDRPDTLKLVGSTYTRYLSHGAQVQFNAAGQHVTTVNRLGQATRFTYDASARPDSILLPPSVGGPYYKFVYNASSQKLDSVNAPGPGSGRRSVRLTVNSDGTVVKIRDPLVHSGDTIGVRYTYLANDTNRIATRTSRRGAVTTFGYDVAKHLASSSLALGTGQSPIVITIRAAESVGLRHNSDSVAARPESVYTRLDGARTDVADITRIWLDRLGEPAQTMDALGNLTILIRDDARWIGLVTQLKTPGGRVVRASYDARGNLSSTTDSSLFATDSLGTRHYSIANYQWDARWDYVTQLISPGGRTTLVGYDTTSGNRLWQQTGQDSARRIRFSYLSSGPNSGLLSTVRTPLAPQADSIYYDGLGNSVRVVSPLGFRSRAYKDNLGRDTLVVTSVSASQADSAWTKIRYDAWDRDTLRTSTGPAVSILSVMVPAQTDSVVNFYNAEGALDSTRRWASPDTARVGKLTNRWKYDLADRKITDVPPTALGKYDSMTYDPAGNLVSWVTRRGSMVTPKQAILYSYDKLNRVLTRIVPATIGTKLDSMYLCCNSSGQSFWRVYPLYANGVVLTLPADTNVFTYDADGHVTTANNGDALISRTYFPSGLLQTDTLRIRTWAAVNAGGNFTAHVYGIRYGYDLEGRRIWMKHPANLAPQKYLQSTVYDSMAYMYEDSTGLLGRVRDVLGNSFGYHYDAEGRLDSTYGPGGYGDKKTYDGDARLTGRVERLPGFVGGLHGDTLHADALSYDARGKIIRVLTPGDSSRMAYAGLGSLAETRTWTWGAAPTTSLDQFMTDAFGHTSWEIPSSNQFGSIHLHHFYVAGTEQDTAAFNVGGCGGCDPQYDQDHYDADGNRSYHGNTDPTNTINLLEFAYYRYDNQLRILDHRVCYHNSYYCQSPLYTPSSTGGAFEEFRYDALNRRVAVRTRRDSACAGGLADKKYDCQSTVERTVWDGEQILYEIRMPGADTTVAASMENDTVSLNIQLAPYGRVAYTHGLGLDAPLGLIRMGYGVGTGPVPDSLRMIALMPHSNWRGTSEFATDPLGRLDSGICGYSGQRYVCPSIFWPAYDATIFDDAPPPATHDWFGGLIVDMRDAAGLQYKRNRYYDPTQGRFTQEDPIGLAGGMNAYGFAAGDPVSYADPLGLKVCIKGDETEVRRLQSALEEATNTSFLLDENNCVIASTIHSRGDKRFDKLRTGFRGLADTTMATFYLKFTSATFSAQDPFNINIGETIIYVTYQSGPAWGKCDGSMTAFSYPQVIAHELNHHFPQIDGKPMDTHTPKNENHAVRAGDNVYNDYAGRPLRCQY